MYIAYYKKDKLILCLICISENALFKTPTEWHLNALNSSVNFIVIVHSTSTDRETMGNN